MGRGNEDGARHDSWTNAMVARVVEQALVGELPSTELKARPDCRVSRVESPGGSVIVKTWKRPGLRGVLRRLSRTGPAQKEAAAAALLASVGIPVPRVLGHLRIRSGHDGWTDALVSEDLGECTLGVRHVDALYHRGRKEDLRTFSAAVLDMTHTMLNAQIMDVDHSLFNIVATPEGRPYRVDFELAYRYGSRGVSAASYGRMLGSLIGTYVFAVQPEVDYAMEFAADAVALLKPPADVLDAAERHLTRMLTDQATRLDVWTFVQLPWKEEPTGPEGTPPQQSAT